MVASQDSHNLQAMDVYVEREDLAQSDYTFLSFAGDQFDHYLVVAQSVSQSVQTVFLCLYPSSL